MKRFAQFALWGAVAAAGIGACSDESASSGDASSGSSAGSNVTGSGAGNTSTGQGGTGGSNSTGSGGPAATVPVCLPSCDTVADCDLGAAYFDVDNHVCDEGACVYQGCNDNSECEILGNYLCHQSAGGFPNCTPGCNTPDDCDLGKGAYRDADNFSCNDGVCQYLGCHSDRECSALNDGVCH